MTASPSGRGEGIDPLTRGDVTVGPWSSHARCVVGSQDALFDSNSDRAIGSTEWFGIERRGAPRPYRCGPAGAAVRCTARVDDGAGSLRAVVRPGSPSAPAIARSGTVAGSWAGLAASLSDAEGRPQGSGAPSVSGSTGSRSLEADISSGVRVVVSSGSSDGSRAANCSRGIDSGDVRINDRSGAGMVGTDGTERVATARCTAGRVTGMSSVRSVGSWRDWGLPEPSPSKTPLGAVAETTWVSWWLANDGSRQVGSMR